MTSNQENQVETRRLLYQELLVLSEGLLQHCQNADWEQEEAQQQLLRLIDQRQEIIDQIAALNSAPLSDVEKQIITEILALDRESTKIAAEAKAHFAHKFNQVQRGKRSAKAYNPESVQTAGYFIDRKK